MSNKSFEVVETIKDKIFSKYDVLSMSYAIQPFMVTNKWMVLVYGEIKRRGYFAASQFDGDDDMCLIFFDSEEHYKSYVRTMLDIA